MYSEIPKDIQLKVIGIVKTFLRGGEVEVKGTTFIMADDGTVMSEAIKEYSDGKEEVVWLPLFTITSLITMANNMSDDEFATVSMNNVLNDLKKTTLNKKRTHL